MHTQQVLLHTSDQLILRTEGRPAHRGGRGKVGRHGSTQGGEETLDRQGSVQRGGENDKA